VDWRLPEGFAAGEIQWPVPENASASGRFLNYGYADHVLFPVRLDVAPNARAGTKAPVHANVSWLVCPRGGMHPRPRRSRARGSHCRQGEARRARRRRVCAHARAFAETVARDVCAKPRTAHRIALRLKDAPHAAKDGRFLSFEKGKLADATRPLGASETGQIVVEIDKGELAPPVLDRVAGLVVVETQARTDAYAVDAISATPTAGAATVRRRRPGRVALVRASARVCRRRPIEPHACVFPVLSLKVLSFIEQAGHDARRVRYAGWVFALGVLVVVLDPRRRVARAARGRRVARLGLPASIARVLAVLCAVLLLLALSLSGVFEVGLSLTGT
jgi:thiol:disulfide interchange protein DsbD